MKRGKYNNKPTNRPSSTDDFEPVLKQERLGSKLYQYSPYSIAVFFDFPDLLSDSFKQDLIGIGGKPRCLYPNGKSQSYRMGWIFKFTVSNLFYLSHRLEFLKHEIEQYGDQFTIDEDDASSANDNSSTA